MREIISVIIPAYNSASRIKFTLESIILQDWPELEIILVDDASSDDTVKIAGEILSCSHRKFLIHKNINNMGVSFARNTGLNLSQGEYVSFIDGDDIITKDFISKLYASITKFHSQFSFCNIGRRFLLDDKDANLSRINAISQHDNKKSNALNTQNLRTSSSITRKKADILESFNLPEVSRGEEIIFTRTISPVCCLYDKNFLVSNNLRFHEGCISGEDVEFQIKALCLAEKVSFVDECLYFYVQHENMGSIRDNNTREKKLTRYEHNTQAQIRTADFLMTNAKIERVIFYARKILRPQNLIRQFTIYAMKHDMEKYNSLRGDKESMKTLHEALSFYVLRKKPEIFFKALMILFFPKVYYRMRENLL